ncbi:MAG: hypothetical protein HYR49_00805 [Gammaproteobacteria bacterium]|nr:hypothetical protein [Gammaproteobacteria bacterium]
MLINELSSGLVPGGRTTAPKGVRRFRTLDEGNKIQAQWLAERMAELSRERSE